MFAFVFFDLLIVNMALASNAVHFANGWIPVARPYVFNQIRNSYMETSYASGWKPSHSTDESSMDYIGKDAIFIITPKNAQFQNGEPSSEPIVTPLPNNIAVENDSVSSVKLASENIEENSLTDPNKNHMLSKFDARDETLKRNVKTDLQRRAPKQLWGPSSLQDSSSNDPMKPDPNIKSAGTQISIVTNNNYEVTEPTNVQELTHTSDDVHNEYTNKFDHLLSKYNIKAHDMLDNYAKSKQHQNKIIRLYPSQKNPVSFVPLHYNSLNHLPVDPLLAVFLSNYGYYLHGFYGLPNNYKNLYGYSASNNIHNNKPFGSYKIYSDTDSST